jgi:hypothetical protein
VTTPFILGVNYWPRRKAMGWWKNFEAGEVHADFALIAELGMKVVRIFLLWEDFQPTPDSVDPLRLQHLHTVADIAADPHYQARGMLAQVAMDDGSALTVPGFVPKLSRTPGAHRRNAPTWHTADGRPCGFWLPLC